MPIECFATHSLLPNVIKDGGVVVDCGANLGAFSMKMVERFDSKVYAFEASPVIFAQLPQSSGFTARNVAVCAIDGQVRLSIDQDIERTRVTSVNVTGGPMIVEVEGVTLPRLIAEAGIVGEIEVLKLDIEGSELGVFDSMTDDLIRRIGQITVEFHDSHGYHSTAEAEQRIARITALGFRELFWSRRRNTADVLLVHPKRLGRVRHAFEQKVVRPVRALKRSFRRTLKP